MYGAVQLVGSDVVQGQCLVSNHSIIAGGFVRFGIDDVSYDALLVRWSVSKATWAWCCGMWWDMMCCDVM